MYIPKGTKIKIKTVEQLENEYKKNYLGFYNSKEEYLAFLTIPMLNEKEIILENNWNILLPFVYKGWHWYSWMFDLHQFKNKSLMIIE